MQIRLEVALCLCISLFLLLVLIKKTQRPHRTEIHESCAHGHMESAGGCRENLVNFATSVFNGFYYMEMSSHSREHK